MGTKANPGAFDCYDKLEPNEPYFVIMGRDPMGQQLVQMWAQGAEMRMSSMVVKSDETGLAHQRAKITEARVCAEAMATYCRDEGKLPMRWSGVAPVITRAAPKTAITREQVKSLCALSLSLDADRLILELARAAGVPE